MGILEFFTKFFFCMFIAWLIGLIVGWLLRRASGRGTRTERENWEQRLRGVERDLEVAHGDSNAQKDQISTLKSELTASAEAIRFRDSELAGLQAKFDEAEGAARARAARETEIETLSGEFGLLRGRLADADAAVDAAKLRAEAAEARAAEIGALKTSLSARDEQVAALQAQIKGLGPLGLQLKDRELRLKEWETKHADALKAAAAEIASLNERIRELEAAGVNPADLDAATARARELEAALAAAETRQADVMRDKDSAITLLQLRVKELEPLFGQLAERDGRIRDLELRCETLSREKDDEIEKLRVRVAELASDGQSLSEAEARLRDLEARHNESLSEKTVEIAGLTARIDELAPLSAQLFDREARLSQFEARFQSLQSEKDAEIGSLRGRIGELESSLSVIGDKDAQMAGLRSRIHDLETMYTRAMKAPPRAEWDDLKLIHGVGPVLEKMLHKLGIYTFRQVAAWNEEQIDWVDTQLEHFHGRIRRENWIVSARDEHWKKYNEKI